MVNIIVFYSVGILEFERLEFKEVSDAEFTQLQAHSEENIYAGRHVAELSLHNVKALAGEEISWDNESLTLLQIELAKYDEDGNLKYI
tara:strand:- start:21789 stop:22052 length:264 start_codon:yes stop_codon:yes gene_type:complete